MTSYHPIGGFFLTKYPTPNSCPINQIIYTTTALLARFVFIMGTSMTFSFQSMFKEEPSTKMIVWKIVWRSVKLFAIGIFLNTKWGKLNSFKLLYGWIRGTLLKWFCARDNKWYMNKKEHYVAFSGGGNQNEQLRVLTIIIVKTGSSNFDYSWYCVSSDPAYKWRSRMPMAVPK